MSYALPILALGSIAAPFITSAVKTCVKSCRKAPVEKDVRDDHVVKVATQATQAIQDSTATKGPKKDLTINCYVTPLRLPSPVTVPGGTAEEPDFSGREESPTPTFANYVSDDEVETQPKERTLTSVFDSLPVNDEEFQLSDEFTQNTAKRKKVAAQTAQAACALRSQDMILRGKKHVKFNEELSHKRTPYFPPACRLKLNAR
jgi:hypothetical protein